jgi:1,4-dihydroxy-2-naphthoyl-CoA hydrolase
MDQESLFRGYKGFDALYGLEILEYSDQTVRAQVPVEDKIRQPFGLVHGGVMTAIAETLASVGTAVAVVPEGNAAMGLSNQTSFLRPIVEGTVHAVATRRHRGRTTWIWDVEISDDAGRLCALSRMTIAVRPMPAAG